MTDQERAFDYVPLWGIGVVLLYAMRRVECPLCRSGHDVLRVHPGAEFANLLLITLLLGKAICNLTLTGIHLHNRNSGGTGMDDYGWDHSN